MVFLGGKRPWLQVALDTPRLEDALSVMLDIARRTDLDRVVVEAGTPLIKSWGARAVEILRGVFDTYTVADTKTMDTGRLEARIMFDAGADAVTVLGVAPDETIRSAVEEAVRRNRAVLVDTISHPSPVERAIEAAELGADGVIMHVGIDVQVKRGVTAAQLVEEIRLLRERLPRDKYIGVAGGLKPGNIKPLIDAGADIVIVGSAITRSDKPGLVAARIIEEMLS